MADESITRWLRSRGGYVSPKLDLFKQQNESSGDRCVCAREAVEEGEQLLLVPLAATLHLPTTQEWEDRCAPDGWQTHS